METEEAKKDAMKLLVETIAKNGGDIEQVDPLQVDCPTRTCRTVRGMPCNVVAGKPVFHKARWSRAFKERKFRVVFTIAPDEDDGGSIERVVSMMTAEEVATLRAIEAMMPRAPDPGGPEWGAYMAEFYALAQKLGVPPGERGVTFSYDHESIPTLIIEWSSKRTPA